MNTPQIAEPVLDEYRNNMLTEERINFLITQANEQLDEIAGNEEIFNRFLEKVKAPKKIDNIILWILLMSNEDIVEEYIENFDKDFTDMIPVCDLSDLLMYAVHLRKIKDIELDGFDYLLTYKTEGMTEVDHHSVTNALMYIQRVKKAQVEIQF